MPCDGTFATDLLHSTRAWTMCSHTWVAVSRSRHVNRQEIHADRGCCLQHRVSRQMQRIAEQLRPRSRDVHHKGV